MRTLTQFRFETFGVSDMYVAVDWNTVVMSDITLAVSNFDTDEGARRGHQSVHEHQPHEPDLQICCCSFHPLSRSSVL